MQLRVVVPGAREELIGKPSKMRWQNADVMQLGTLQQYWQQLQSSTPVCQ